MKLARVSAAFWSVEAVAEFWPTGLVVNVCIALELLADVLLQHTLDLPEELMKLFQRNGTC